MTKNWNGPPPIYVFVTVRPTAKNGLKQNHTSRVGTCKSEGEVPALITKDLQAMRETFGGLVPSTDTSGRTYRAFRAEWSELDVAAILKKGGGN